MSTATELYEQDCYAWTQDQAARLRAGVATELDREHLAEEIESMGKRDKRELLSRLEELLMHLLKWRYQPGKRRAGSSWEISIAKQRNGIADLLNDSPSLRPPLTAHLATAYQRAKYLASRQTRLPPVTFPDECPFTLEQVLDANFWPDAERAGCSV